MAAVAVPAGAALPAPKPAPPARQPLEIKVGQSDKFSRIEFHWAGGAKAAAKRDGQVVTVRFNRNARPDMSQLKVFPPKWLKSAEAVTVGGALEVRLTLADDADAKVGQADGATFVNLFPKPAETAAAPVSERIASRPNPVPDGGVVRMAAQATPAGTSLQFPWKNPVGAAVFRRGDIVWVVFDAKAGIDLSKAPKVAQITRMSVLQGADWTAVRIASPGNIPVQAQGAGGTWTVTLGAAAKPAPVAVNFGRDKDSEIAALSAAVAGATRTVWITDPSVGDKIAAVTALAPSKGLAARRQLVDLVLLPTAQGLAIEPRAQDLAVDVEGDLVKIGRPAGLALSSVATVAAAQTVGGLDAPQPSAYPGLVDFEGWSKLGPKGFFARYDALQEAATTEAMTEQPETKSAKVQARMALARFLVGSELSFEAIGVMNLLASQQPQMLADPEFRALRGAAKTMAGRYTEATVDLAAPSLAGDPASALWRGYIAAQSGRSDDARKAFAGGYSALNQVAPKWRARFARADAEAALALGDLAVARTQTAMALAAKADDNENMASSLVRGKLLEAEGDRAKALAIYDAVTRSPMGELSSEATLRATQIRLTDNKITPAQAIETFDGLRYRWRGDATEIETIQALGKLYLNLGRYREALEVLRSAGRRLPDLPEAVALQDDLAGAFRALFLEGRADGMEPIQSLALFFDFRDMTPIGAEGDMMVRKLARRLVDVDLLDQAATLLKYQTENRLEGVAKAQVATDLALIYLMDRKPEEALGAINASRTTVLPSALNLERRRLTARALSDLGRYDGALEILTGDRSAEADEVRAEVAWKSRDWKQAGPLFEKRLGDRFKAPGPLKAEEEGRLLRAAISYSLADDAAGLGRLRGRYEGFVESAAASPSLKIALAGLDDDRISPADFSRVVSEGDTFAGWVSRMKTKFREKPAPTGPAPAKPAPVKQAAAQPTPPAAKG